MEKNPSVDVSSSEIKSLTKHVGFLRSSSLDAGSIPAASTIVFNAGTPVLSAEDSLFGTGGEQRPVSSCIDSQFISGNQF